VLSFRAANISALVQLAPKGLEGGAAAGIDVVRSLASSMFRNVNWCASAAAGASCARPGTHRLSDEELSPWHSSRRRRQIPGP
jgi:hypothetical protein